MSKDAIRQQVRNRIARARVVRFPDEEQRIPNFRGAENAATLLRRLTIWRRARCIKFDLGAPQIWLRRSALAEGKTVYLAIGNMRTERCFLELDPQRLGARAWRAASFRCALQLGRLVTPDQLPAFDLVIAGALAVNRQGAMLGAGGGGLRPAIRPAAPSRQNSRVHTGRDDGALAASGRKPDSDARSRRAVRLCRDARRCNRRP